MTLTVHDLLGRRVAVLAAGPRDAGTYAATWEADGLAQGVYIIRLEAAGHSAVTTAVVAR